jgi:1-acyl-sn-glycerol-3-phosphate acyltransferase
MCVLGIDHQQKVFVARADIFRDPKKAKILNWLKIMPISRVRDGLEEVRHNDETMHKAVETLHDGVPFCIFAEGTHHPDRSLLPLSKGIFRIALQANENFGETKPVYIVPVGIAYGDYFHLWNSVTVTIGEPMNVTEFVQSRLSFVDSRAQLIMELREILTERMKEQIAKSEALREKSGKLPRWIAYPLAVLLFPLFVVSALMTIPLWGMWLYIQKHVQDPAFHNSVQYVWQLVFMTLTLLIPLPFWMFVQEYLYQLRVES